MSTATLTQRGFDLGAIAEALAPRAFRFDPFGLVSGYRAYLIYTGLAAKSNSELAKLGITRRDIPRIAAEAADLQIN